MRFGRAELTAQIKRDVERARAVARVVLILLHLRALLVESAASSGLRRFQTKDTLLLCPVVSVNSSSART
jgi:hypothetical protein